MKKGWPTKRIGEVATIGRSKSEPRERLAADASVSFLPMEDLGSGIKNPEPKQTKRLSDVVGSYTYFAEGDVLLAKITPCFENGKLGIATGLKNGVGFGSSEFFVLRPNGLVINEWLFYFLSRADFRKAGAQCMGGAVGQRRVPREFIETCEIPAPPLAEQQRIVRLLDTAFADLAAAKTIAATNLQNASVLLDSHLQSVFTHRANTWVQRQLGDVCDVKDGTHDSPVYVSEGIPFVTQKNIREDGLSFDGVRLISPSDHEHFYRRSNVARDDILISMIGANRGMACLVEDSRVFSIKNVGLVKQSRAMDQHFLLYFLKSRSAAEYVRAQSRGGAQEFIGLNQLRRWPVPVPPLKEQRALAKHFSLMRTEIRRLRTVYGQKLATLDALKESMLDQAFSGAL